VGLVLAAGRKHRLHRHESDYLYVVIGDGALQGKNADGSDRLVQHMSDGEVRFREIEGQEIHEAVNVGNRPWRNVIVELK